MSRRRAAKLELVEPQLPDVPPASEHRELTDRERAFVEAFTRLIVEQWHERPKT